MSWGCPGRIKSRNDMIGSPKDGNSSYLCFGIKSPFVPEIFEFKNFKTWLPATYNSGRAAVLAAFIDTLTWTLVNT